MTALADLDIPEIDLSDPDLKGERWHETMNALLAEGHWLARGPLAIVILDREAGEHFLRSRSAVFPGLLLAEIFGVEEGPLFEQMSRNIINSEGDTHRRLRGLVNPSLSPRAAARYRPMMREILGQIWSNALAGSGARPSGPTGSSGPTGTEQEPTDTEFDFMEAVARPYPARTIARIMGAPDEDAPLLHDWSMWIQRQFDPIALADAPTVETMQKKAGEFYGWVRPLIEARRETPSDDLISNLIRTEEEGERLSNQELENLILNIMVGGVDTTQSQLAQAMRLLAADPEQWQALRSDPDVMAPRAASEALRFEPITPFTARLLAEDVEYRGVTFPAGTPVMVCSFTGNRDPGVFADPQSFDITADREKARILTFGAGIHYCVGANIARAELEEALAFLASRIETLEPAGAPDLQTVSGIYGLESLPLNLTTA
ncbi:MAG: cytochrome P450 [Solirubrobacterales bacterium]